MIRAPVRLLLLALWALLAAPFPVACFLVTLGSRTARARTGPFLNRIFSRGICAILGIRIGRTGAPPRGACLVTPNHWGYVDVFVLGAVCPSVFVSQAEVARWPVIGPFARAGGTLFLRREVRRDAKRVAGEIERLLRGGCRVTAFLEGGDSDGRDVRPFRSPLVSAAVAAGAPCVPVALRYSLPRDPGLDPGALVAWTSDDFVGHAWRLLALRRIDAHVTFLAPRTGTDRKRLARELEADVRAVATAGV